jgi:hypothetical protein
LVRYTDIAIGAKEDFSVDTGSSLAQSNNELFNIDSEEKRGGYTIPLELNSMVLDGSIEFLPENEGEANIAYISENISNENGRFETPIQFSILAEGFYASTGITLIFDEIKNIYATHLNIKWYRNNVLLHDEYFYPTSANYFCNAKVDFYNKIVITFYSLNLPSHRLRMSAIEYGLKIEFKGNELKSAKIIQEIDPISSSIPANTFDFTIDSKRDIDFSFQARQPIECYFNNKPIAVTFIKNVKRKSKTIWDIKSEDYIGLMDTIYFKGGLYTNKRAEELLGDIFSVAKIPYELKSDFSNVYLTGYIPYTTCREALMQVVFAMGAVADTSNNDFVKIFYLKNAVSQKIPKRRIFVGQNFDNETRVTAVELVSHSYSEISDTVVAYEAQKSGSGSNIFVMFSEPLHSLSIQNGSVIESGVNYAIINANSNCVLTGQKYEHTRIIYRKENPFVLTTDIENVISIENATLISLNNVDKILNSCYNYLVNTEQTQMKISEGKNDNSTAVGDFIACETEYLGEKQGRIIKQSFSLVGGILAKDSIMR